MIFLLLIVTIAVPYWKKTHRQQKQAKLAREKSVKAGLHEPATLHPHIDLLRCIGCAACVRACPEDALGIVNGRAAVVHGVRCVGHALCAEACPVSGITMGFGKPQQGMEIPFYDEHFMTNIRGLYIVGELGGIGLIKNAFEQSKKAIDHIAESAHKQANGVYDVAIVGAGPAGIGAALAAQAKGLTHIVLEQDDLGGSILHYPRQKLVLTAPVELPLYGRLKISEISKEELLGIFSSIVSRFNIAIQTRQRVESVSGEKGQFVIQASGKTYRAANTILALGRRGSPRKLNVPGEELPKVFYRLIEAETYHNKHILVVGGGNSAVEAAIGLARQRGNTVTLSYRRDAFVRLKEKNEERINDMMKSGTVRVMFNSQVTEIRPHDVDITESNGKTSTLPNDFVFIFAGGELPSEFLKKVGVKFRTENVILA